MAKILKIETCENCPLFKTERMEKEYVDVCGFDDGNDRGYGFYIMFIGKDAIDETTTIHPKCPLEDA